MPFWEIQTSALWGLMAMMLATTLAGCTWFKSDYVVPEYPTAREQAMNAKRQYEIARGTIAEKVRDEEFEKAIAALEFTINKFPDDNLYIPEAKVYLGLSQYEVDDYRKAESTFIKVIDEYGDIPTVHSLGLYWLSKTQHERGRFREEKETLRQFIETYGENKDPKLLRLIADAKRRYSRVE